MSSYNTKGSPVELTIESALKELGRLTNTWPNLLHALGIDRTIEIQIRSQHPGDDPGAMEDMLRHWFDNYNCSWDKLARAFIRFDKSVGAYFYNKYVNPECFTPEKISEELSFISDWFELAHPFLDDSDKIRAAIKNTPLTERRVRAMEAWIESYDMPSWEEVAQTVEDIFTDHVDIPYHLRKKYLPEVKPMKKEELPRLKELNSEAAFDETRDIEDWFALGWFLGLSEETLLNIEEEHFRTDSKRQAVLDLWLEKDKKSANWLTLGKAINKMSSNLGLSHRLIKRAKGDKDDSNTIKAKLTARNAVKEIDEVPWQLLLAILGIDQSLETQIFAETDYPNNIKSMERVLCNWMEYYESSWETLAMSLMSVPFTRAKGAYIYNKYVNPESFSIENVSRILISKFTDLFQLAYSLFGNSVKLRRLFTDHGISTKGEVIDYWMRHGNQPSWEKVAVAIENCLPEHFELANSLRKECLPDVQSKHPSIQKMSTLPKNLDANSVIEATEEIKDWFALGRFLGFDDETLYRIDKEKPDGQRQAILETWLKGTANWRTLGEAIRNMNQHSRLSERIMNQYSSEEKEVDDHVVVDIASEVFEEAMETVEQENDTDHENQGFQYISESLTDMREYAGGIQLIVKRLSVDSQSIRGIDSAIEEMKTKFDELKTAVSQLSLRYEHVPAVVNTVEDTITEDTDEDTVEDTVEDTDEDTDEDTVEDTIEDTVEDTVEVIQERSTEIPKSILEKMEIIFEETMEFASDRDYTLNLKQYGCQIYIKKGSIRDGETGRIHIYGIYSGPFYVPEDIKLVSSIYYVSLSHELLKPATLEIQHCCRAVYDNEGKCNLSFVSALTTSSGPPYKFDAIQGGHFLDGDYGIIQRKGFSGYAVAFVNWVKSFFRYPLEGPPQEKRIKLTTSSLQNEPAATNLRYGVYYFLIATATDRKSYVAKLLLTQYLDSNERYFRKLQEGRHPLKIVKDKFEEVKLTGNGLVIDVSEEKEGSELLNWKGHAFKIKKDWEIMSESTGDKLELLIEKIRDRLAPSVDINIYWTGSGQPPPRSTFRIHCLGIEGMYSFPVTVPFLLSRFSSSLSERYSSFEEDPDDDRLSDPPTLKDFLTKVAPKSPGNCDQVALQLLQDDTYKTYRVESKDVNSNQKYECLFQAWEKEAEAKKFTWTEVINVLRKIKEKKLATDLQDKLVTH